MNWVGTEKWGGLAPSQTRKDRPQPPHWRLEVVAAVSRPHHLVASPDRSQLVFTLDRADLGSDIWQLDLSTGECVQITADRPPAAYWEDTPAAISFDATTLAYESDGWIKVAPLGGGIARPLVKAGSPVWLPDGRLLVSVQHPRERTGTSLPTVTEVSRLCILDPADPWPHPITPPTADVAQAAASPDGSRVAATLLPPDDRNRSDIVTFALDEGPLTTIIGEEGIHSHSPAWSPSGHAIAFVSETTGWYEIHLATGGEVRRLTQDQADFGAPSWLDDSALLATRTLRGRTDIVKVDAGTGSVEVLATGGVWSDPVAVVDSRIIAIESSHTTPNRITEIGVGPILDPAPRTIRSAQHASPIEVTYQSADGTPIHGFLFKPRDASADRPAAAVVYPHGGPTSHYGDEWDGHAQYFIDKGYAWFAINFRGSTSYGRSFERAAHDQWGVVDTADCLAAATYLESLDWIDGSRLAIFGASYGSYMALTALTSDPLQRYACAVAKFGDCDILTSWAQGDRGGSEDLERQMRHPSENRSAYRAGSPIHDLDNVQRPILIAHGELDHRVHLRQSEELVRALEKAGKTFEFVTYPTEGHGLFRVAPQLDFYKRLEKFLDWYLL